MGSCSIKQSAIVRSEAKNKNAATPNCSALQKALNKSAASPTICFKPHTQDTVLIHSSEIEQLKIGQEKMCLTSHLVASQSFAKKAGREAYIKEKLCTEVQLRNRSHQATLNNSHTSSSSMELCIYHGIIRT